MFLIGNIIHIVETAQLGAVLTRAFAKSVSQKETARIGSDCQKQTALWSLHYEPYVEQLNEPNEDIIVSVNNLVTHLQQIPDARKVRVVRYTFVILLVLLILAKLGGEDRIKELAKWVQLREQILLRLLRIDRQRLPVLSPTC